MRYLALLAALFFAEGAEAQIRYVRMMADASSDPATPCVSTTVYFNTSSGKVRVCQNAVWTDMVLSQEDISLGDTVTGAVSGGLLYTNVSGQLASESALSYDQTTNTLFVDNVSSLRHTLNPGPLTMSLCDPINATDSNACVYVNMALASATGEKGIVLAHDGTTRFSVDRDGSTVISGQTLITRDPSSTSILNSSFLISPTNSAASEIFLGVYDPTVTTNLVTVNKSGDLAMNGILSRSAPSTGCFGGGSSRNGTLCLLDPQGTIIGPGSNGGSSLFLVNTLATTNGGMYLLGEDAPATSVGGIFYSGGSVEDTGNRVVLQGISKLISSVRTEDVPAASCLHDFIDNTAAGTNTGVRQFCVDGNGALRYRVMTAAHGATCSAANAGLSYYREITGSNKSGMCMCQFITGSTYSWKVTQTASGTPLVDGDC